jgi:glutamate N-acetyltransferase/amino-acid N-acetyltransferase
MGFLAGATYIGLKKAREQALDLGILFSRVPCAAAGLFTLNRIKTAPVVLSKQRLAKGRAQAIVVNSGCANACTGQQGLENAENMTSFTAKKLKIAPDDVLVASTGVIGEYLPMKLVRHGLHKISLATENGHNLARAILTTDTCPKEVALRFSLGKEDCDVTIGGTAKGAGMIHPDLATMLCFLTTDAAVEPGYLTRALKKAVDKSFNLITIDGDTSPNDSVIILANGLAGNHAIEEEKAGARDFEKALEDVCVRLAKWVVRDGEGVTRLIEVTVEGALSTEHARSAARTVAGSSLVKTAVNGSDPNWGRIIAALGRSGAEIDASKIEVYIRDTAIVQRGISATFDKQHVKGLLNDYEIPIRICLNMGKSSSTAWGCDLSADYVRINSEYTT